MSKLKLDYNFMVEDVVPGGIGEEDFERYKGKARNGLNRLMEMVNSGEIGFPKLPEQNIDAIRQFAKESLGRYNDLILVGIGGSSLGIEALVNALLPYGYNGLSFAERGYTPRLWVLDNVDPTKLHWIIKHCQPSDTMVCVVSKSGSTVETAANFAIVYEWLQANVKDITKHVVAITDPEKGPLHEFAKKNNIRMFPIADNIGGRFSVLSPVGLVPAALLGIEVKKLLRGAARLQEGGWDRIIAACALYMYNIEKGRKINVLMPYSSRLDKFAEWYCQLWGESLGKQFTKDGKDIRYGSTPVGVLGAIDQHSQVQLYREGPLDKVVTFVEIESHDFERTVAAKIHDAVDYLVGTKLGSLLNMELKTTEAALRVSGVPSMKLKLPPLDEETIAELMMFFMYVVPIIGLANNINPFDQPGVEEGKQYAYGLLGRTGYEEKKVQFHSLYKKHDTHII